MTQYNNKELEALASRAAEEAIIKTFSILGVDLSDVDHVNEFRADLVHIRKVRRMQETIGSRILLTIASLVTGGVLMAGWAYLTQKFGN